MIGFISLLSMPRQARLDAPGILHHVIIRGIERREIFLDDEDREDFLNRMTNLLPDTHVSCYAWSLMPNHAHLLLRTGDEPLATLMRRLLTGYAIKFNNRYGRHGPLFQNRYKSIICQEDAYLKELVRYIHLNPLRAEILNSIHELNTYPYTGHSAIIGRINRPWQDTDYVLLYFGKTRAAAIKEYISYVKSGIGQGRRPDLMEGGLIKGIDGWEKTDGIHEKRIKGDKRILGDNKFVEEILKKANEKLSKRYELMSKGYDLDFIEQKVCEIFGLTPEDLNSKTRQKKIADARALYCFWAVRELGHELTHVAKSLRITPSAVVYAIRRGQRLARKKGYRLEMKVI